jgi:hypothetical protein
MTQSKQAGNRAEGATITGLSQEAVVSNFHAATRVREASEKLAQEILEASLSSQETGARAAKEYTGSLARARHEWMKKADDLTEKALSISPSGIDYPWKREIEEFNASVLESTKKAFEFFAAPFLAAPKR